MDFVPEFVQILLDVTQYEFLPVTARAFSLLYRHFSQVWMLRMLCSILVLWVQRVVMVKNMLQMQIVVVPEIACTIDVLQADISEIRRNWKWVVSAPMLI